MTPEEQAVIDAAIAAHCFNGTTSLTGCAPESCGGSRLDPCQLHGAVSALLAAREQCVCDPLVKMYCEKENCRGGSELTEWHPATFADVLAGDRLRLGQDEATVLRCNLGIWHADTSDAWRPKAWTHTGLRMELDVVPGFRQYLSGTACEILCTPERLAVLRMNQAFPGSTVIGRPEGIDELPRIGRGMDPL